MSYNTRIKLKSDTESNWLSQDPVLLDGEVAIVKCDGGITRKKIGDGSKKFSELAYDESKSLGLASAAVGQIPKVKAVDSNGVPTEWETAALPSGGTGNMKKLTLTGAVTGEYDGTTDVSVDIPSDVYALEFDTNNIFVNDFDELVNAIKNNKILVIPDNRATIIIHEARFNFDDSNNIKEVFLLCIMGSELCGCTIDRDTKKFTSHLFDLPIFDSSTLNQSSGNVYWDKDNYKFIIKDLPVASTSTAGTIKVGNGLSITNDGTLSVTTATYYTGTSDPVDTLGADGDLYLKTEG